MWYCRTRVSSRGSASCSWRLGSTARRLPEDRSARELSRMPRPVGIRPVVERPPGATDGLMARPNPPPGPAQPGSPSTSLASSSRSAANRLRAASARSPLGDNTQQGPATAPAERRWWRSVRRHGRQACGSSSRSPSTTGFARGIVRVACPVPAVAAGFVPALPAPSQNTGDVLHPNTARAVQPPPGRFHAPQDGALPLHHAGSTVQDVGHPVAELVGRVLRGGGSHTEGVRAGAARGSPAGPAIPATADGRACVPPPCPGRWSPHRSTSALLGSTRVSGPGQKASINASAPGGRSVPHGHFAAFPDMHDRRIEAWPFAMTKTCIAASGRRRWPPARRPFPWARRPRHLHGAGGPPWPHRCPPVRPCGKGAKAPRRTARFRVTHVPWTSPKDP